MENGSCHPCGYQCHDRVQKPKQLQLASILQFQLIRHHLLSYKYKKSWRLRYYQVGAVQLWTYLNRYVGLRTTPTGTHTLIYISSAASGIY